MTRMSIGAAVTAVGLNVLPAMGSAQTDHPVTLHVNPRWSQCSFQLDPSLTQAAWHQFAAEAGLVTYFRPLTDARPLGSGHWELAVLQWTTGIDDADAAWNDTFVHPYATHWLFEGSGLAFPGITIRRGMSERVDAGVYFTKNVNANYGFYGAQVQVNVARDARADWNLASRLSFVSLFGPEDLSFTVYGADLVASKGFTARWVSVAPYAGASTYLSRAHETSAAVALADENVVGLQAMAGAAVRIAAVRIGVEYNTARVSSRSLKVGVAF